MKSRHSLIARTLGLSATFLLLHSTVPALAGEVEKAVEYRQGVMNVYSWNMKAMGDMMKGKTEFDKGRFAAHAEELSNASKFKLMNGFPEDSESDESDALAEIWMDFEDFESKYQDFGSAAQALEKAAQGGDKVTMGAALKEAGKSCKACHKKYKN
ncbi:MAG: cytochrome c [Candidatus Thiodiazotropha taylori]|nr:cytochrome c [Candidatus Thiodiazotropha taylori]MCG7994174.1 cytochrome c [Candidatus Thiodiazotropha taylori]